MSLLMMFLGIYMALFRIKMPISLAYIFKEIYTFVCYTISKHKFQYIEKKKPICTWISIERNFFDILWHFCWLILNYPDTVINLGTIHHEGGRGWWSWSYTAGENIFMNNDKHLFSIKQCRDNHLYEKQICWVGVSGLKQLKEMIYMPTRADTC